MYGQPLVWLAARPNHTVADTLTEAAHFGGVLAWVGPQGNDREG